MIEYWDRLKKAMDNKSVRDGRPFDITELAAALKLSYQAVAKVKKGGSFGKDNNLKAAKLLGVSSDWLASGEEAKVSAVPFFPEGKPVTALFDEDALPEDTVLIRESRVRFAGGNGHVTPHYEEVEDSAPATYRRSWFTQEGMNPTKVRRFQVTGSSMEPFLYDGDTVLVNMAETDVRDGKVYALRYGDELKVKRCYRRIDGSLILHSDNPFHKPQDEEIASALVDEHITVIGRVREKAGKGGL